MVNGQYLLQSKRTAKMLKKAGKARFQNIGKKHS